MAETIPLDGRIRQQLERRAYHEAGHAVATHLLGRKVQRLSISSASRHGLLGRGLVNLARKRLGQDTDESPRSRARLEKQVLAILAGIAAERKAGHLQAWSGANDDLTTARDLASHASWSDEEAAAYFEWLRLRSEGLISHDQQWPAVHALAQALLSQRRLSGRQAEEIICRSFIRVVLRQPVGPLAFGAPTPHRPVRVLAAVDAPAIDDDLFV